jgi:hypothetical protein
MLGLVAWQAGYQTASWHRDCCAWLLEAATLYSGAFYVFNFATSSVH